MKRLYLIILNIYIFSIAFQNNIISTQCETPDGLNYFSELIKPIFYNENLNSLFAILDMLFSFNFKSKNDDMVYDIYKEEDLYKDYDIVKEDDHKHIDDTREDKYRIKDDKYIVKEDHNKDDKYIVKDDKYRIKDDKYRIKEDHNKDDKYRIKEDKYIVKEDHNKDDNYIIKEDDNKEDNDLIKEDDNNKDDINHDIEDYENTTFIDREEFNNQGYTIRIDIERDENQFSEEIDEIEDNFDENVKELNPSEFPNSVESVLWNWCHEPSPYFADVKVDMTPEVLISGQDVTANIHGNLLKDLPSLILDTKIQYNMFPPVRFVKDLCEEHSIECPVSSGVQTHKLTYHIPPLLSGRIKIEANLITGSEEIACIIIGPLKVTR